MRRRLMWLLFKKEVLEYEEERGWLANDIRELIEMQELYEEEIKRLVRENRILGLIVDKIDIYKRR